MKNTTLKSKSKYCQEVAANDPLCRPGWVEETQTFSKLTWTNLDFKKWDKSVDLTRKDKKINYMGD